MHSTLYLPLLNDLYLDRGSDVNLSPLGEHSRRVDFLYGVPYPEDHPSRVRKDGARYHRIRQVLLTSSPAVGLCVCQHTLVLFVLPHTALSSSLPLCKCTYESRRLPVEKEGLIHLWVTGQCSNGVFWNPRYRLT